MTVYYVSKKGNDFNTGTESSPFLTIQKSIDIAIHGDIVYIKHGIYNENPKINSKNIDNTSWIKITNYQNDIVTIDGTGLNVRGQEQGDPWEGLIFILFSSYIEISGLTITNSSWFGIFCYRSENIKINNCYVYNTYASGIIAEFSSDFAITKNELNLVCNAPNTAEVQECLSIATSNDVFEVSNNYVHNGGRPGWGGEGINIKNGASNGKVFGNKIHDVQRTGIYVDAWNKYCTNIDVYNNMIHDIIDGSGISVSGEQGGTTDNINIYNNIIYNSNTSGIRYPSYQASQPPIIPSSNKVSFINNTIYNCTRGIWINPLWIYINNCIVRNNILSNNEIGTILINLNLNITNTTIDNNLLYWFKGYSSGTTQEVRGMNYIEEDPKFVNITTLPYDFHLQSNSPAVDKGNSINAPPIDYDNKARPVGPGYDVGAYEYGLSSISSNKNNSSISKLIVLIPLIGIPLLYYYRKDVLRYYRCVKNKILSRWD